VWEHCQEAVDLFGESINVDFGGGARVGGWGAHVGFSV